MYIRSCKVQNYRNIEKAEIEFSPGVNLLWGDNAQGKTNLLEALYTFARGKSFRGAGERELVRDGCAGYEIRGVIQKKEREISLAYRYYNQKKERFFCSAPVRAAEMIGHLRAVLFCPDHLQLVKGGPGERRQFLNIAIAQLDPLYIGALSRYEKILSHRNAVLKEAQKTGYLDEELLDTYSSQLAEESEKIAACRLSYSEKLDREAAFFMKEISSGKEKLTLSYVREKGEGRGEDYLSLFRENIARERAAGCTLYGPHRDDLMLYINGKEAGAFASQGQMRSVVLSMKLGEGILAEDEGGEKPVFLFDDVLSELDEGRRAYLLSGTSGSQTIITSCETRGFSGIAAKEIRVSMGDYRTEA